MSAAGIRDGKMTRGRPIIGAPKERINVTLDEETIRLARGYSASGNNLSEGIRACVAWRAIQDLNYPRHQARELLAVYWDQWMAPGVDYQESRRSSR